MSHNDRLVFSLFLRIEACLSLKNLANSHRDQDLIVPHCITSEKCQSKRGTP